MLIYIFSSVIVSFYCYIYYKHLNEIIYKIDIAFMDYIFWILDFVTWFEKSNATIYFSDTLCDTVIPSLLFVQGYKVFSSQNIAK